MNTTVGDDSSAPLGPQEATGSVGVGPRELVVMISSIMALMAVGIDLMLPGFDDIREAFELGEGSNRTGQIITSYFFGLAVAQLFYGPLADRFGRKPVLYLGIAIYSIGAAASALAPTFESLLAARFLWGIGAAGARVVATAIIRDRFEGSAMAKALSQIMAVFILVPVIAPTAGAAIIAVFPWRFLFWFCVIWAGAVACWSLRLRETLAPEHVRPFSVGQASRSYAEVLRTPGSIGYAVASIFIQAVMTLYLATSELIIRDIYGFDAEFPLIFGVVALLFGVGALLNGRFVETHGIRSMMRAALAVSLTLTPLLVVLSVTADGRPAFWLFMPLVGLTLSTFMVLMPNLNTAAMMPVGHIAGSASALISALRLGVGSAIAAVANGLIAHSVTPFVAVMLAMCVGCALTIFVVNRVVGESSLPVPEH